MRQKIIDLAIKYWQDFFTGISGSDVAKKLDLDHDFVLREFENLRDCGLVTVNENVTLYTIKFELDEVSGKNASRVKSEPFTTHILFPSKQLLGNYYNENLIQYKDDGAYVKRLRNGGSQIGLVYFDIEVLNKYLSNLEVYEMNDDITSGVLRLTGKYKKELAEEELDKVWFDKVWYGKRKLASGNIAVAAIQWDLSCLPIKEQAYWNSYEIENPIFPDEVDKNFGRFYTRAYEGEWIESEDPIEEISKSMNRINKIFDFTIFVNSINPYIQYPVNNTKKSFIDSISELYKLLDNQNLKIDNLKNLYLTYLDGTTKDFTHKKSLKALSSLQVFLLILEKGDSILAGDFKTHLNLIKENRIEADHKVTYPDFSGTNFVREFTEICSTMEEILYRVEIYMKKVKNQTK